MHGHGVYFEGVSAVSAKRYDGHWDCNLRAGFGFVVPSVSKPKTGTIHIKRSKYEGCWTYDENDMLTELPTTTDEELPFNQYDLTPRDWKYIYSVGKDSTVKDGASLFSEGSVVNKLIWIKSGGAVVQKKGQVLSTLGHFQLLGEFPLFGLGEKSQVVVKSKGETHIFEITMASLVQLFTSKYRFIKYYFDILDLAYLSVFGGLLL